MSKKQIEGFTITILPTSVDAEGYERCSKCKAQTALVYPIGDWIMDSEAFKNGEELEEDAREEMHVGEVSGHWCDTCEILTSLTYNF